MAIYGTYARIKPSVGVCPNEHNKAIGEVEIFLSDGKGHPIRLATVKICDGCRNALVRKLCDLKETD